MQQHLTASHFFGMIFLLLTGFTGSAQEAFEVSVDRNSVRTGEQVQVTFTLKNIKRSIDAPDIEGLKLLFGPSTSNSTSIFNGTRTSERTYTFTYQVTSKSNITVPAFELRGSKSPLKSKAFTIQVTPRGQTSKGGGQRDLGNVACIIEASKRNVHIGEPLTVSFKIFNRANNLDVRNYTIPETPGFWKETVETSEPRWEPQIISGKRYNVATVRTMVLFPQQTGTLIIDGFDLVGYMRTSFFDGQNVTASADPIKINVTPLPEPIPRSFLGSFGRLRVSAEQSERECSTNEAITFDLTFSGEGNIKFIQDPDLNWPGEFEVFDPEVIDRVKITENGETGSRTFRYVVIPRAPGDYAMPLPSGQWFNWRTNAYSTLNGNSLKLSVNRNDEAAAGPVNYNAKTDVQVLNQDINFIHTEWSGPCLPKARWDHRKPLTASLLAIGPMLFGLSAWVRRRRNEWEQNPKSARKRKARQNVRKELRAARNQVNTPNAFYPALGSGLEQYLLAKLEWNSSQMQRDALLVELQTHVPNLVASWKTLLDDLDLARYAPAQVLQPNDMLQKAESLVSETEKAWNA